MYGPQANSSETSNVVSYNDLRRLYHWPWANAPGPIIRCLIEAEVVSLTTLRFNQQ